jgi:hypothetical protein
LHNKDNTLPLLYRPDAKIVHLRADKSEKNTLKPQ